MTEALTPLVPRELMLDPLAKDAETAFDAAFAEAKNGDRIVFPLERSQTMYPHPHGAIFQGDTTYSLNGIRRVYRGSDAKAYAHPDGVLLALRTNDSTWNDTWLLLNGERLLFAGLAASFVPHTLGAAIRTEEGITLNGTKLLVARTSDSFATHPDGVLVEGKSDEGEKQLLVNGERVVYEGAWDKGLTNMYGRTVVVAGSTNYARFTSIGLGRLYEGPYTEAFLHPQGVVIKLTRKRDRFLLNGEALLYDHSRQTDPAPAIKKVHDHPRGIVIELRRNNDTSVFLFDGSVTLFEGEYDNVVMHPEGMLVRCGSKFFLCVHKFFDPDKMIV
jgi:hypothetical protein